MRKAGGIIALIAGILGVFAAVVTLGIGGVGTAMKADNASTVLLLGWGGVIFSFLTIILGALAMNAVTRLPGLLLILSSIAGAVLGGTLVAIFMALSLAGGLLAVFGGQRGPTTAT